MCFRLSNIKRARGLAVRPLRSLFTDVPSSVDRRKRPSTDYDSGNTFPTTFFNSVLPLTQDEFIKPFILSISVSIETTNPEVLSTLRIALKATPLINLIFSIISLLA